MKRYINKETGEFYNGLYIIVDDKQVFNPTEEILLANGYEEKEVPVEVYTPTEEDIRLQRMEEILQQLKDTDYLSLKAFEGEDMSEHPTWKEDRKALREEYRKLENQTTLETYE